MSKICPQCSAPNEDTAIKCEWCGAELGESTQAKAEAPSTADTPNINGSFSIPDATAPTAENFAPITKSNGVGFSAKEENAHADTDIDLTPITKGDGVGLCANDNNTPANDDVDLTPITKGDGVGLCANGKNTPADSTEDIAPIIKTGNNSSASTTNAAAYSSPDFTASSAYTQSNNATINDSRPVKSKLVAALLSIFLGGLGIHKFYLGQTGKGVLYLVFCWTYIPAIIAFIDGIIMLCTSNEKFEEKYNCRVK